MSSASASRTGRDQMPRVRSLLSEACAEALPNWLETRRWFADKGRGISGVAIEDALVERVGSGLARADGGASHVHRWQRGSLSLAAGVDRDLPEPTDVITGVASGAVSGVIVDATEKPWFGGWLLDQFAGATERARGAWVFAAHPAAGAQYRGRSQQSDDGRARGAEQLVIALRRPPDRQALPAVATGSQSRRRDLARAG